MLSGALLVVERAAQRDADDESLRAVVEVVEVDDGDLRGGVDAMAQERVGGDVGAHEARQRTLRRQQSADERVDRARPCDGAGPRRPHHRVVVGDPVDEEGDEIAVGAQRLAVDPPPAVARGLPLALQRGGRVVHDHRVLLALVLGVGEHEGQQLFGCELLDGPEERVHAELTILHVGSGVRVVAARRRVHGDVGEPAGRQPEVAVLLRLFGGELDVLVIEEEQILALHVEDERLRVRRVGAEHAGGEQPEEQEGRVRGLRRDAGDARDVDVRAARTVEEVEVQVHRETVAAEPDRQPRLHLVEEQRDVALGARRAPDLGAGLRRNEHLGIETRGEHLRGFDVLRREHTVGDEEDVGVETRALLAGPHLGDDAREPHRLLTPRNPALAHDDVVELEVLLRRHRDPEREGRRVFRAEDAPDGFLVVERALRHLPTVPPG